LVSVAVGQIVDVCGSASVNLLIGAPDITTGATDYSRWEGEKLEKKRKKNVFPGMKP
jgi:hypothetical protein